MKSFGVNEVFDDVLELELLEEEPLLPNSELIALIMKILSAEDCGQIQ
jgi:hypothetical protein